MDEVGVVDVRVGVGDAGPGGSMAQLGERDAGKRIALADGELRGCAERSGFDGNENLRACGDEVRIAKAGIIGKQFAPAETFPEIFLCELPEGVTRFYDYNIQLYASGGCRRGDGLRRRDAHRGRKKRKLARRRRGQKSRPLERRALHVRQVRNNSRRSRQNRRRTERLHRRLGRSEHRSVCKRQMEFRGALKLQRFFFSAVTARDVAERSVGGKWLRVILLRDG